MRERSLSHPTGFFTSVPEGEGHHKFTQTEFPQEFIDEYILCHREEVLRLLSLPESALTRRPQEGLVCKKANSCCIHGHQKRVSFSEGTKDAQDSDSTLSIAVPQTVINMPISSRNRRQTLDVNFPINMAPTSQYLKPNFNCDLISYIDSDSVASKKEPVEEEEEEETFTIIPVGRKRSNPPQDPTH